MSDVFIINDGSAATEIITGTADTILFQEYITSMNKTKHKIEQLSLPKKRNKRRRHKSYFGKSYEQE